MKVVRTVAEMKEYARQLRAAGDTVGLVPTMGYLHEGHLSLMRRAGELADHVVASIFVNPTQFGPGEDLDSYPRDLERDIELAGSAGVECIFFPDAKEMYPEGFCTYVNVEDITSRLCGASRPVHFRGVTTVVSKLFNIVRPDTAVFGQKDYQQFVVISRMVRDLDMDVNVVSYPIVREADGLAMSSRNKYLSGDERQDALVISTSLSRIRGMFCSGERNVDVLKDDIVKMISSSRLCIIDYVEFVDALRLEPVTGTINVDCLVAVAVKVGGTRLIDNVLLEVG